MPDFNFVTNRVATGGMITGEADVQQLIDAGITDIIDCQAEQNDTNNLARHPDMHYIYLGVQDDGQPKPVSWFQSGIEFALDALKEPHRKVYAHCFLPGTMIGEAIPFPIEKTLENQSANKPYGLELHVMNGEGKRSRVVAPMERQYNGNVITVKAFGNLPITCTPNHKFMVLKPYRTSGGKIFKPNFNSKFNAFIDHKTKLEPQWVVASDLEPGDCLLSPKMQLNSSYNFDLSSSNHKNTHTVNLPNDFAWLAGLYAGDGSADKVGISICMGKNDDQKRAYNALISTGAEARIDNYGEYSRVSANSVVLARTFEGYFGKRQEKHIPGFVFGDASLIQEALDGVLHADGWYYADRRQWHFDNTSLSLAWQVWHMALTLGHKPYISLRKRTTGFANASPMYHVTWTEDGVHSKTFHWDNHYAMPIKSVESSNYNGPVYNMEVEDTHDYIANGAWVSNCAAGVNRGPSMCYAILIAQGIDYNTAETLMRQRRPQVNIAYKLDARKAVETLGYVDPISGSAFGEVEK